MATAAKGATAKDATNTPSKESALRETAPQVRTVEALYRKHEQVLDAAENERLSPKTFEQINATLKGMRFIGIELGLRIEAMRLKYKQPIYPRSPMLRSFLGLPETPTLPAEKDGFA